MKYRKFSFYIYKKNYFSFKKSKKIVSDFFRLLWFIFLATSLSCASEIDSFNDKEENLLTIHGQIFLDNREPSESIEILFEDESGKKNTILTDNKGFFKFSNTQIGDYKIKVYVDDFEPYSKIISHIDYSTELNINLKFYNPKLMLYIDKKLVKTLFLKDIKEFPHFIKGFSGGDFWFYYVKKSWIEDRKIFLKNYYFNKNSAFCYYINGKCYNLSHFYFGVDFLFTIFKNLIQNIGIYLPDDIKAQNSDGVCFLPIRKPLYNLNIFFDESNKTDFTIKVDGKNLCHQFVTTKNRFTLPEGEYSIEITKREQSPLKNDDNTDFKKSVFKIFLNKNLEIKPYFSNKKTIKIKILDEIITKDIYNETKILIFYKNIPYTLDLSKDNDFISDKRIEYKVNDKEIKEKKNNFFSNKKSIKLNEKKDSYEITEKLVYFKLKLEKSDCLVIPEVNGDFESFREIYFFKNSNIEEIEIPLFLSQTKKVAIFCRGEKVVIKDIFK